jgi:hypothetical protein
MKLPLIIFWLSFALFLGFFLWAIYRNCQWRYAKSFLTDIRESIMHPFKEKHSVYTSGILLWVLICICLSALGFAYRKIVGLSGWDFFLLLPAFGQIFYLVWNWKLIIDRNDNNPEDSSERDDYTREVDLIKFVERHANYMIFGVTGVFIAAQYFINSSNQESIPNFSVFYFLTFMSLLSSVWGVLPLIWSPKGNGKHLEWLRHYKTVWYGYAIFLLCAGILAFAKAIFVHANILPS